MINPIELSGSVAHVQSAGPESRFLPADPVAVARGPKNDYVAPQINSPGQADQFINVPGVFGALSGDKDAANRVAGNIRGLGEARSLVSRVRESLELIVKSFPPFPPGSLERERFLNSVAGIRAMIEKLTFPPELGKRTSETLSDEAFTSAAASDAALNMGLARLDRLDGELLQAQSGLGEQVHFDGRAQGDDGFYVAQSQGVGKALMEQAGGIVRAPGQLLGLMR